MFLNLNASLPDYVSVSRRAVKWARIEVQPDGSVRMIVPQRMTRRHIFAFYEQKSSWIDSKRDFYAERSQSTQPDGRIMLFGEHYQFELDQQQRSASICPVTRLIRHSSDLREPGSADKWYRQYSKIYLTQRINELALATGLNFNRLYIRDQKTRWGSCSNKKNISLNWRLVKAPPSVSSYVIIHELAHTREMNHSARFWQLVEQFQPDYRQHRQWLKSKGHLL